MSDFLQSIRDAAGKRIFYTLHALDEMNAEDELITIDEVRAVIFGGELIEDYPEDKRGHSCLMLEFPASGRPVHVVCAPKQDYLAVITTYIPSADKWEDGFRTRRKKQ